MLRPKIFLFEQTLAIYFLLQAFLPGYFTFLSAFNGFFVLAVSKYFFEGFRANFFITIIIQLLLLISNSLFINLPLCILMYFSLFYFPVYKYPNPTGPYRVGYRRFTIAGVTSVGIYYPTRHHTKDVRYTPDHRSWERFADLLKFYSEATNKKGIPRPLFKFGLSFLEHLYLGVNEKAPVAQLEGGKPHPVVVFSHGLSANIHLYSIQLKEWASHGFVVFSIDHEEDIYLNPSSYPSTEAYMKERTQQIENRKKTVRKVLDMVCNKNTIHDLFEDKELSLNYEKLFFAGHSFGGATMAELAVQDKRATGVLLLDPWFQASNEGILFTPINKPVLSLRSNAFEKWRGIRKNIFQYGEVNKKKGLSGYFKNSVHNSSTDLLILLPRELVLIKKIKSMKTIQNEIQDHALLTRVFLQTVLESRDDEKVTQKELSIRTQVLERFRAELKKAQREDILMVDE